MKKTTFFSKDLRVRDVLDSMREAVMLTDPDGNIQMVNPAFCAVTGYSLEDVAGKNPRILQSGRHSLHFYQRLWSDIQQKGVWQGEIWNRRKSGEIYPEWLTISAVKNHEGRVTHYLSVFMDITGRKRFEEKLEHLAHFDALTNLPNRMLFRDRLTQAISQAVRQRRRVAVMFLDLDGFKDVNDSLGHAAGDWLLVQVAERLRSAVRESDTVARFGGDEFIFMLYGVTEAGLPGAAEKILQAVSGRPYDVAGQKVGLSASLGLSLYPADGREAEALLREADVAMYRAKKEGGKSYAFPVRRSVS